MSRIATLTDRQLQSFHKDGFLIARGLFSDAEIRDCSGWIDEIASRAPEIGRLMVYFEDSLVEKGARVLARIERFAQYHEGLGRLVADARITGPSGDLL